MGVEECGLKYSSKKAEKKRIHTNLEAGLLIEGHQINNNCK